VNKLPLPARTLVALVAAGGTGCLVANLPGLTRWDRADVLVFLLLAAGVVIGEQFQLPVRFGSERLNLSLTEAVWVGALVLARASVVTMAVAVGVFIGHALRRRAPFKVAFNVGQFVLALTAAELIVGAVRGTEVLGPMSFLAVGLGMAAYAAVNAGLVALAISQAQGKRLRTVLFPPLPENAVHFAANTALGLIAAVLWHAAPQALPILLLPVGMCFVAVRALLQNVGAPERAQEPVATS
jgi:hypothetical protein